MSSTDQAATVSTRAQSSTLAKGAAIGAAIAVIANVIVFAIANSGAPVQVISGNDTVPSDLPIGPVIVASIMPIVVGAIGLWLLERFRPNGFRIWTILALVLAVVSIGGPLSLDIDTGSQVALTIMHLVVGVAAVAGHTIARKK